MAEVSKREKSAASSKSVRKALKLSGFVALCVVLAVLLLNTCLNVFVDGYYPTFGGYRLFSVVSDSMEDEIPTGSIIACKKPRSEDDIQVGSVITYVLTSGGTQTLITHRVTNIYKNETTGDVRYTTKGDNAEREDSVRPFYSDVVGVYTGRKCGFLGYIFGFLQSTEGAIALIIVIFIIAITLIVAHFVSIVTMWRKAALAALKKSGDILADTQVEELGTIADVIGIVSKEPTDKPDLMRKDKKLNWFVRTGSLPKRPYSDDLDESAMSDEQHVAVPRLVRLSENDAESTAVADTEQGGAQTVSERYEKMRYKFTFAARVIQLKPQVKEWYSLIKNEMLSYDGVRVRSARACETFMRGRGAVARMVVRGKTLCLRLACDPSALDTQRYAVEKVNSGTPCQYRIKSARRAERAVELIAAVMGECGAAKVPDYVPVDYYAPFEGVVSLMQKGLVKRDIRDGVKTFRIDEISDAKADAPLS